MAHAVQLSIAEFLRSPTKDLPADPADPFALDDLLVEADMQKVSWDVAAGECWLLFDLKGAFQYPSANTAVMAVDGVRSVEWAGAPAHRPGSWGTFMIMGSLATFGHDSIYFKVSAFGAGTLTISGADMGFWTGDVPGGDDAPPDYVQDDSETIRAGLTSWDSPFTPMTFTPGHRSRPS